MAILEKGIVRVSGGSPNTEEFDFRASLLTDGEYGFFIFDKKNNPMLPMIQYINGVLIQDIYKELKSRGVKVSRYGLYKFFEQKFSPKIKESIGDVEVEYFNMKKMKVADLKEVAQQIKDWAKENLNLSFTSRNDLKGGKYNKQYAEVQANAWKNYNRK